MASRTPSANMDSAMKLHSKRSSHIYMVMVRRGKRSMMELQERVRKCDGLERTDGRCER